MKKKTKKNLVKIVASTLIISIVITGNMYKPVKSCLYDKGEDRIEYSRNILPENNHLNKTA